MSAHREVITDAIMDMLEAAKSGVVPGSVSQAIQSGQQNVPSNIKQHQILGAAAGSYTTFPLSPLQDNCCVDKTYVNLEFITRHKLTVELSSVIHATHDGEVYVPYFFGFRDGATIPNQLQILIENSPLYDTVYQREESVLAYNSLPETVIRGNSQYASIEKMKQCKRSPMQRVVVKVPIEHNTDTGSADVEVHHRVTIDLNRLTPLLSNLSFTTPHMGNLKLKLFFQEIAKAMFFCPDYGYYAFRTATATASGTTITPAEVNTAIERAIAQPIMNQYWSFYSLSEWAGKEISGETIPFYAITLDKTDTVSKLVRLANVTFDNPTSGDFMSFDKDGGVAEIVQTTFKIVGEEYDRLSAYFAQQGAIIIPSQTWATNVFNNSELQNKGWNSSMIGTVGGYNIDFISVWFHSNACPAAFCWEPLNQIQLLLDGRPINALPYRFVNDKAVVDFTQAIGDTDHDEINADYVNSLNFLNENGADTYLPNDFTLGQPLSTIYGDGSLTTSMNVAGLYNPNTWCMNFSTNLPNAFHSGACTLEAVNRQGQLRLVSTYNEKFKATTYRNKFPYFTNNCSIGASSNNATTETCGFSAFCDCCIILKFDATRNRAFDGLVEWAAPYQ